MSRLLAVATQGSTWLRHFTDDEYTTFVVPADNGRYKSSRTRRQGRREFIEQWPDLGAWMAAPVADRLMHAPPYAAARHRHVVVRGHRRADGQRSTGFVRRLHHPGRRVDSGWRKV
jgi:hypothetical protein